MTDQQTSTREQALEMLDALAEDEQATAEWLMREIRTRFGASDRFDSNDPVFSELSDQLVSRLL